MSYLAARGLGEPERPCVHERVLDVEVLWVVEDGADLALASGVVGGRLFLALGGVLSWRDGDRVQRNLLVGLRC